MINFKIEVLINATPGSKSYSILDFIEPDYAEAKAKALKFVKAFTTKDDKVRYFVDYEIRDNETGQRKSCFSEFMENLP